MRVSLVVTRALLGLAAVPRERYSVPSVACSLVNSLARAGVHTSNFSTLRLHVKPFLSQAVLEGLMRPSEYALYSHPGFYTFTLSLG